MLSKSQTAIKLSALKFFSSPNVKLEQYPTDSEVAADFLHNAKMLGDIEGKHILDLGAGTGVLGIGALLMGASFVTFLDIDNSALDILKENLDSLDIKENFEVIQGAVTAQKADTVVMNPPFGTKSEHADRDFLVAAMNSANTTYSVHLASSEAFIDSLTRDHEFARTHTWKYDMPLKQSMKHHKKALEKVTVIVVRLQKQQ